MGPVTNTVSLMQSSGYIDIKSGPVTNTVLLMQKRI